MNKSELEQTIKKGIRINPETNCHIWQYDETTTGYGTIRIQGAVFTVRRVLWWLKYGYLPQGKFMSDTCGCTRCCNLDHVLDKTPENERRTKLFRSNKFNSPRLSPEKIKKIWSEMILNGGSMTAMAKQNGVSAQTLKKHLKKFESGL